MGRGKCFVLVPFFVSVFLVIQCYLESFFLMLFVCTVLLDILKGRREEKEIKEKNKKTIEH